MLAVATFAALRSSNRSARVAEQSLLNAMRPLLVPSLGDDPVHKLLWGDGHTARLAGGRALVEQEGGVIYLGISLRNLGSGIGLLHGWHPMPDEAFGGDTHVDPSQFRRLAIDLYVPPGGTGYWESAVRDPDDPARPGLLQVLGERRPFRIDILYGDQQGGQRTVSRYVVLPSGDEGWYAQAGRHWSIDRPDPR